LEKVIYVLWRHPNDSSADFSQRLRGEVADELKGLAARGLQINVADAAVEPAAGLRQVSTRPQMEGMLSLWVDTAIGKFRRPFDAVIEAGVGRMAAYLVTESQPICNTKHPATPGERTAGFSQLAFLNRPPWLLHEAWLDVWHNSHTQVAIDTQSTFFYVQNVVVRSLTHGAPQIDAVVEECFPSEAMTTPQAFFDAVGDEDKFQRNVRAMTESCRRFIEISRVDNKMVIDVVPTSQYVIKRPASL
jgi:hypothetical protein